MANRDILMAIAQVAATFIGFAGVVFAVGRASEGGVTSPERTALIHLLIPAIAVLFLAFAPLVASAGFTSQSRIWRVSNGLLRAIHRADGEGHPGRDPVASAQPVPVRFIVLPGGSWPSPPTSPWSWDSCSRSPP